MQLFSRPILYAISFAAINAVTVMGGSISALAQTVPGPNLPVSLDQASLASIEAALAYPNSAQRFFEAGNDQFEEEIQRLSAQDTQSEPLLTVKPEVLEQFEEE